MQSAFGVQLSAVFDDEKTLWLESSSKFCGVRYNLIMPVSNWSRREMLEVQFRKHIRRGNEPNVVMAPTWAQPNVPAGEVVILEVINRESIGVPFTESGFFAPGHGFVRYDDVREVHWISRDIRERIKFKGTNPV